MGIIIGIIDGINDQQEAMTPVNSQNKVEVAQVMLGLVSKCLWSGLSGLVLAY